MDKEKFNQKFYTPFVEQLYHPDRYQRIKEGILLYKTTFDRIYEKFQQLNHSWGFKIFSKYVIDLNMYVSNGSYTHFGHILLGIKGGRIKIDLSVIKKIMHEMIHLGIEELIVKDKHGNMLLAQNEKERIVDNLCQFVGEGIFPKELLEFQEISESCSYMDKYVQGQPQSNLVKNINKFLKEKGIEKK